MPKSKKQKETTVADLKTGLQQAKAVVFANFQGLTVAQSEELRKISRAENVEMLAAKKSLVKRALEEAGITGVDPSTFEGGVATFIAQNDEIIAAKIVQGFAKRHEIVKIFGGILEGKFIDSAMVKSLAALPSKKELLGKLVGTMNAPISGFVNVCAGTLRGFMNVLNAYKDKKAV